MTQTLPGDNRQCYLTINEFAKRIGVHPQTLRAWDETGIFQPHHRTPGGHRRYAPSQVDDILENHDALILEEGGGQDG